MKVADFFCGAGGFSEGFRQAGFEVVFAVDKWLPAIKTHHENHPNAITLLEDVEKISKLPDVEFNHLIPDTEIIIGSPPCVAFSNSNKSGRGNKELGIRLLESYLRIIARKMHKENSILKYWILENVPNIQKYIKDSYSACNLGIDADFELQVIHENSGIYNSKFFGVAQNRKRFLCGLFPTPQKTILNEEGVIPLRDILARLGDPIENMHLVIKDPNYNFYIKSEEISDHHYIRELAEYEWKKAKQLKEDKGYMGKMSFPEDVNKPSRTVLANGSAASRETTIFQYKLGRYRLPTIRELATIMSFPLDYRFYGQSKGIKSRLVGNAVPPKMSYSIANAINEVENIAILTEYVPIKYKNNVDFINLNNKKFELKIEKPRKEIARYKYHIPYLIINTYRVELTNNNSQFKDKIFRWDAEIHKSQGGQAKVYVPDIEKLEIETELNLEIKLFCTSIAVKLNSFNEFQRIHCMTSDERIGLIGPNELLESINSFILKTLKDGNKSVMTNINEPPFQLPKAIVVGYYILSKLIENMRGI